MLGNAAAVFPLRNPGIVSIPLAFVVAVVVAMMWPEPEAASGFSELERRVHLGEGKPAPIDDKSRNP